MALSDGGDVSVQDMRRCSMTLPDVGNAMQRILLQLTARTIIIIMQVTEKCVGRRLADVATAG